MRGVGAIGVAGLIALAPAAGCVLDDVDSEYFESTAADSDESADRSIEDIVEIATGEVVGVSTVTRTDSGVSMTYHTSDLEPGDVATTWWMIFNNPEACENPGNCTGADYANPEVEGGAFIAAGTIIGDSGHANYGAHLPVDTLTVDPDPDANQVLVGDPYLTDARGAQVSLALRTHGPMIPELVHEMLRTHDAGCVTAPPDLQGPNTCETIQVSAHSP